VTLHLKAIYAEGELTEETTCKDYLQVRDEGARQVSRKLRHYLEFPRFRGQLAWRDSASGGAQEGGGTPTRWTPSSTPRWRPGPPPSSATWKTR
jgi:hypothetical protein